VREVEDLAEVAAEPVQGVDHDRVAGPGVGQEAVQALAVGGRAGFLVDEDPLVRDALRGQCVELALQRLLGGREGPATISSPLPEQVQRRLWEEVISAVPRRHEATGEGIGSGILFAVTAGWLYWPSVAAIVGARGYGLVILGSVGITLLICAGTWAVTRPMRKARATARVARAARAALAASQAVV
jgi:hypothetical protein